MNTRTTCHTISIKPEYHPPAPCLPLQIRQRELAIQRRIDWIKTVQITMVFATPPVTALVIFSAYELNVGKISSTLTFPILSLFNILRFPLVVLPKAMRAGSDMLQSIERVQAFLVTEVPERQQMGGAPGVHMVSGRDDLLVCTLCMRLACLQGCADACGLGLSLLLFA